MRPEISALIRQLKYPHLADAAKTKNRPQLRGVQGVIVFINHGEPEDITPQLSDRSDISLIFSKQNSHEVVMVLKIVRYLAQQGYGTETIVILTPYLGQLHKLQEALRKDNDPILNDLDSYDLVRAGLLPVVSAKIKKKSIRLATIGMYVSLCHYCVYFDRLVSADNYQGEESDIVIVTLTRSNADHDIGFMSSPQRLNVLLSRARDAIILIGNSDTFLHARKGGELWGQFFDLLKWGRHIYDGLPV
jgi:superfamily I DNA and/or RNA helicase